MVQLLNYGQQFLSVQRMKPHIPSHPCERVTFKGFYMQLIGQMTVSSIIISFAKTNTTNNFISISNFNEINIDIYCSVAVQNSDVTSLYFVHFSYKVIVYHLPYCCWLAWYNRLSQQPLSKVRPMSCGGLWGGC